MLGHRLLQASGLAHYYPEPPPEVPNLEYSSDNLDQVPGIIIEGEFMYRSKNPLQFPHHIGLFRPFVDHPFIRFNDRIWLHIVGVPDPEFIREPSLYSIRGWIIGVHFATSDFVEFVILGVFEKALQIIFLDVLNNYVDKTRCPPLLYTLGNIQYWSYMSIDNIEARAKVVQNVDDDLTKWSRTYRIIQANLMRLRCTPSRIVIFIDPITYPKLYAAFFYIIEIPAEAAANIPEGARVTF
ncbi:hypothetical protein QCA50_011627 [Cerrena zonata]|uniref:Uncharacterized protein n=1 Tax=Cerrena zonata TaxID=2478898 RepID=A0AAW0G1N9_9APHY